MKNYLSIIALLCALTFTVSRVIAKADAKSCNDCSCGMDCTKICSGIDGKSCCKK